jgi:hypothetical protein
MTGETIECFNCGRANPSWAQVCRFCGVPLVAGVAAAEPSGLFPTDQRSLISMGAAIGTIVVAVIVGLIFSSLNPTDPTVGVPSSPTPHASVVVRPSASTPLEATPAPTPTPKPTPALAGKLVLGTGRNRQTCEITGKTDTFGPGSVFAQSISLDEPFGVNALGEEIARVTDGKEKIVQSREDGQTAAPSKAKIVCYAVGSDNLIRAWGAGTYVLRIYRGDEKIAQGTFKLTE